MNKSFLKWAGGKLKLLDKILPHIEGCNALIEPFCGSGVVWMNSKNRIRVVADINVDLINLFSHIQKEGNDFIKYVETFFVDGNNQERYIEYRDKFNSTQDSREKSALFIYLNRHCYNGLWRYNKEGKFNVAFFKHKTIYFPREEMMTAHAESKKGVVFVPGSFEYAFTGAASPGDVIYCDPPFDIVDTGRKRHDGGYVAYGKMGFGKEEQIKLARFVKSAPCKVVVSNSDTPFIREIYAGLQFYELSVRRFMACKEKNKMGELLIVKEQPA